MESIMVSNKNSKQNGERALKALRRCEGSPAWERVTAYVVLYPNGRNWGSIKCAWPKDGMGPLHVFLWDGSSRKDSDPIQYGKASGCGYDKLSAAMCGMTFDGLVFGDHPDANWEKVLRVAGYKIIQAI